MSRFCNVLTSAIAVALLLSGASTAEAQLLYSLDIGSDLDMSDPGSPGPGDAGDIYAEGIGPAFAGKNDTAGGPNPGFPWITAAQPLPTDPIC